MIILFIFNKPIFMVLLVILLIAIIFYAIYYFTEKDNNNTNKIQTNNQNKVHKPESKPETRTNYEFHQPEDTTLKIQNTYNGTKVKDKDNTTEIVSQIVNDDIILNRYVYCCSLINNLKENNIFLNTIKKKISLKIKIQIVN